MASTKEIFDKIRETLSADPGAAGGLEAVYQFNLSGEDGAVYQIILKADSADVAEGTPAPADCTLELTADDFKALVEGRLNGMNAFMSGQLRVLGDIGLAMRLEQVLSAYAQ
ncbi:hypothetical protein GCM10025857_01040 [Alicyclobacillus contaminans]|uniref:SCP2 sterol-binding domain-containing protein n=1 Tax=Alicyclobacillus contaminans TaxID=392016 RepID=UPI0003F9F56F|nr:SCP2 sterol-binding domain-containing protein [Alicyclobacillus contaminans]GMA48747.1 hypothetical protein GCM10025857_01040 [Alicyclobacillus contaminans]